MAESKPSFIHKFRLYNDSELKRVIKIYFKWVRNCSCNGTLYRPSKWDNCEFCFKWQHAKRELYYRNSDQYCLPAMLKISFPDFYNKFCKVSKIKLDTKKCL